MRYAKERWKICSRMPLQNRKFKHMCPTIKVNFIRNHLKPGNFGCFAMLIFFENLHMPLLWWVRQPWSYKMFFVNVDRVSQTSKQVAHWCTLYSTYVHDFFSVTRNSTSMKLYFLCLSYCTGGATQSSNWGSKFGVSVFFPQEIK